MSDWKPPLYPSVRPYIICLYPQAVIRFLTSVFEASETRRSTRPTKPEGRPLLPMFVLKADSQLTQRLCLPSPPEPTAAYEFARQGMNDKNVSDTCQRGYQRRHG